MEPTTSKLLLSLGIKIVTPIMKLIKSKLEKELYIYTILRKRNAVKPGADFNSVYIETLYQLISTKNKNKGVVKLFELDEVKQAFKNEIYQNNNWAFNVTLDSNLHTNPNLRKLKKINLNLNDEIKEFQLEFKKVINTTREPKEIENSATLSKIKNEVSELIDTKRLNEKFKTEVEIDSQIIFSKSEVQLISDHISQREKLVESFLGQFKVVSWVAINGGISTGKTQLSVLLTQEVDVQKFWINLRELSSANFLFKIFSDLSSFLSVPIENELDKWQSKILDKIEKQTFIVLDDLPKLNNRSQSFNRFVAFIKASKTRNVTILSTSNFALPTQIKDSLKDGYIFETTIPNFNISEVFEILLTYDIGEEKANGFKTLIHSLSSGHPVIIKAICEYLLQRKWILSNDELSNIFRGDYSLEINEDTYEILSKTVLDENTRNLLYRLNIVNGTFTIDDVRIIGNNSPRITNSIEKLNSAIGIWIQKRDLHNYEVSPLLKRLKSKDLSPQLERKINHSLGKTILDRRKLNQFEASKAITYFVTAKSYNDAGFVLTLVLNEAVNNPKLLSEWGFLYYWNSTPLPKEMDLLLQLYIRTLQILLKKQENNETDFLITDLENICSVASKKGINVGPAHLLLSSHYSTINSSKALNYLMTGNDQYNAIIQDLSDTHELDNHNNFETMIWAAVISIKSIEDANYWFETISKLKNEQLLDLKKSDNIDFGSILIFKSFKELEEKKPKETQNWNGVIDAFISIQEKAKSLDLVLICANAIRYIINIYSDKLNSIDEAHAYALKYLNNLSNSQTAQFLVNDAIGRQLFYHNKIEEATQYVAIAVDIEVASFYIEKLDAFLVISQILGEKDSNVALHFSMKAKEFTSENEFTSDILKAKVIGELSVSLFLNNDTKGAIYELEKGYQILLDSYNINSEYHITILRYGHALNYWNQLLTKGKPPEKDILGGDYEVPKRGMFLSNFDESMVEEYYFPERRFIVSYLLLNSFEAFHDYNLARKWAFNNISVHNEIDFNNFSIMNSHAIPYLIIDNKYIEAIELQISTIDNTNELNTQESRLENLSNNKFLKHITADRPKTGISEYDDPLIEYVILPIFLNFIMTYSSSNKDLMKNIDDLENVVSKLKLYMKDTAFVDSLQKILTEILSENDSVNKIKQIGENYTGKFTAPLKTIGYLFASILSTNLEAFKLHFAVVKRLDTNIKSISKGTYSFILIPFFEHFWFNRIENNSTSNMDFWKNKSKPYYESAETDNKVKCLFKILVHHLNYEPSNREDEWLEF